MSLDEPDKSRPRVSIVIPNYNGIEHLPECLQSLASQSYSDFEVVLVDNASTDSSVAWVCEHYPDVRIVQRTVNGGPVRSTNDGFQSALGEYIVLVDNDIAADPDWLQALVQAMDDHPEYDYAVSMVLHYGEDALQAAGEVYSVARLCNRGRGSGRPASGYSEMRRVVAATGNGVIHRRDVFDTVGLYDEDYYAMFEDIDFSLRCLLKGKRCLYVPGARISHKLGLCREVLVSYEAEMNFARNGMMMAARVLPIPLLVIGMLALGWRELRLLFPLRPRYYRSFPERARRSRGRHNARCEGLRLGWAKRQSVWGARENSRREIYRWLLRGEGPV